MIRAALRSAGLDRAVFFTIFNRVAVMLSAVITLILVVAVLPPELQGYYFTFSSLLMLQSFLELGMGIVLVQFVSHEFASVQISGRTLTGAEAAVARIRSLARIGICWYGIAAVAFAVVVGAIGTVLLGRHDPSKEVLIPWWLLSIAGGLMLLSVPLRSLLEGSNQVARVQRLATIVFVSGAVAGWLALICGLELYSLPITAAVSAALGIRLYARASWPILRLVRLPPSNAHEGVSWSREFWPQQWRLALSLISGFWVFQSFVPVLFYFQGPIAAGQFGASMQLFNAVNTLGQAWGNARAPRFGQLGAAGNYGEIQCMVRGISTRATLTAAASSVVVLAGIALLSTYDVKSDRFVSLGALSILLGTAIALQRTSVETLAVRFQKVEPFVAVSVTVAAMMLVSNVVASRYFGAIGVCIGFAAVMLLVLVPWVHGIYIRQMAAFRGHVT